MRTVVSRIQGAAKGVGTVTFMTGNEPVTVTWAEVHAEAKVMAANLQRLGDAATALAYLSGSNEPPPRQQRKCRETAASG